MPIRIPNEWKKQVLSDFGGLAIVPKDSMESLTLTNTEVLMDGSLKSFQGTTNISSTDLGSGYAIIGVGTGVTGLTSQLTTLVWSDDSVGGPKVYSSVSFGTDTEGPYGFTDITGAASLDASAEYVSFAQGVDAAGTPIILFCNQSNGVWKYDGSGDIEQIVAAPATAILVTTYQGYTVVVVNPTELHFSERHDPDTWPVTQVIELTSEMGPIRGLASLPDKLLLFFKEGISTIYGRTFDEISSAGGIVRQSASIGCNFPISISMCNNEIGLMTVDGPVILDPSGIQADYISEPIREVFIEWSNTGSSPGAVSQYQYKGLLTPFHYIISRIDQTLSNSTETYIFQRQKRIWWKFIAPDDMQPTAWCNRGENFLTQSKGTYPAVDVDGNLQTGHYAGLYYNVPPNYGVMYGANDGRLHVMNFALFNSQDPNINSISTWADGSTAVTSTWRSKWIDFGSQGLQKQIRKIQIDAWGKVVSIIIHYIDRDGSEQSIGNAYSQLRGTGGLPINSPGGWNPRTTIRAISIELIGSDLDIRSIAMTWKGKRIG